MRLITCIIVYLIFIAYIGFTQFLIFGYGQVNDKLQKDIDNLMNTCQVLPQENGDLKERYEN